MFNTDVLFGFLPLGDNDMGFPDWGNAKTIAINGNIDYTVEQNGMYYGTIYDTQALIACNSSVWRIAVC